MYQVPIVNLPIILICDIHVHVYMSLGGPETGHGTEWEHRNEATEGHMWGQGKGGDDWGHERLPQV